jgi:hypothetical protein
VGIAVFFFAEVGAWLATMCDMLADNTGADTFASSASLRALAPSSPVGHFAIYRAGFRVAGDSLFVDATGGATMIVLSEDTASARTSANSTSLGASTICAKSGHFTIDFVGTPATFGLDPGSPRAITVLLGEGGVLNTLAEFSL